ncbi:hypothetical protein [Endozoicomonas euniceicola]|uniref:Uncharacterized protein n=1 Tax=Endozoicomonas euniceicola TaxID=1234143 RepID=A0ABY6GY25_9GAMM|nr:hypothetical protein [Endozoicomonas euniceicola]UYM17477.1 hypothetical protein NX720_06035 [Endozoicomonas euniceicola]
MERLFKTLFFSTVILSASTNVKARLVHQLATVDDNGNAVVIEYSNRSWTGVFNGALDDCPIEKPGKSGHPRPKIFQDLDDGEFAFACSNGHIYIGRSGQSIKPVQLPTRWWSWFNTDDFQFHYKLPFLATIKPWQPSPAYFAFHTEFKKAFGKNWLFVMQKGYLFIIDIDRKEIVNFNQGVILHSYFLSIGKERENIDKTKPMTGFDIYKDEQGDFNLAIAFEQKSPSSKTRKSTSIMKLSLAGGIPGSEWINIPNEAKEHNPMPHTSEEFKCAIGRLSTVRKEYAVPNTCHYPLGLPHPPPPNKLEVPGIQIKQDVYHSYAPYEKESFAGMKIHSLRTSPSASGREEL